MFRSVDFAQTLGLDPPARPDSVIQVMLGKPLDFDPGARYAYSNYGYCLLGRVIEKLSGLSYEQYVKTNVLEPLGITAMRIGATQLSARAEGEVRYYDPDTGASVFAGNLGAEVPQPYGAWYLEAMDSHGAWLASATDLVRFACAFDAPEACPLLSAELVHEMFARPSWSTAPDDAGDAPPADYYGLGWSIQVKGDGTQTAGHGGSLPGTNTQLVRQSNGRNFAILFNTRLTPHTDRIISAALPEVQQAIDRVETWPEHDLFD
jgi:N-acyl-D-amino-acid deacylase